MNLSNQVIRGIESNNIHMDIYSFNSQEEYDVIVNSIKDNYTNKVFFTITIETKFLLYENISIKYIYLFAKFLTQLKRLNIQYLKQTTMKVYDERVYDLLYYLFLYLSSPVATVQICLYNISSNEIKKIKYYYPI
jgi:hypothetical protein